jgi:SAM-dependent methyltransferase
MGISYCICRVHLRLWRRALSEGYVVLAKGYDSGIAVSTADIVFAIDMFHHVSDTNAFLREVYRISKPDGFLILSGGHLSRTTVKTKIAMSEIWEVAEERKELISYRKLKCD